MSGVDRNGGFPQDPLSDDAITVQGGEVFTLRVPTPSKFLVIHQGNDIAATWDKGVVTLNWPLIERMAARLDPDKVGMLDMGEVLCAMLIAARDHKAPPTPADDDDGA